AVRLAGQPTSRVLRISTGMSAGYRSSSNSIRLVLTVSSEWNVVQPLANRLRSYDEVLLSPLPDVIQTREDDRARVDLRERELVLDRSHYGHIAEGNSAARRVVH